MKRWCAIPLALRVGLILKVLIPASYALDLVLFQEHASAASFARWVKFQLAMRGWYFVAQALLMFGALELARLLVGRAASGARLAATAWGALIVAAIAMTAFQFEQDWPRWIATYVSWGWFAVAALVGLGFALAAWRRPIDATLIGAAWVTLQCPAIPDRVRDACSINTYEYLVSGIDVASVFLLTALALVAVRDVPEGFLIPAPQRAREGLGWIGRSLWLRVAALVVVPLAAMMMVSGTGHEDPRSMMAKAAVIVGFINIASLTLFGFGALDVARSHHAEVRRWPFLIAASASLWSAGVTTAQLAETYRTAITPTDYGGGGPMSVFAAAFTTVVPVVSIGSLIAVALAISGFAMRRGNVVLATRGKNSAILVGTLQLAALGVALMMKTSQHVAVLVMAIIGALVAGLVTVSNVARLASDARALVKDVPSNLPAAQIVL